jgi:hypothetical protein
MVSRRKFSALAGAGTAGSVLAAAPLKLLYSGVWGSQFAVGAMALRAGRHFGAIYRIDQRRSVAKP